MVYWTDKKKGGIGACFHLQYFDDESGAQFFLFQFFKGLSVLSMF